MKTQTEPLPTTYYGEVMFVEYDGDGHPFNVLTREPKKDGGGFSYNQWDFDWSKHMGCSYFHKSGGGDDTVTLCGTTKGTIRFWAAAGVTFENMKNKPVRDPARLGYVRLPAPLEDPFEGGIEGEVDYCALCNDWTSDEDRGCRHIFWNDRYGMIDGPGADNPADVPASFDRVIRLTGCARALRKALRTATWAKVRVSTPLIGMDHADVTIAGHDFSGAFNALHHADDLDVIREGLGWFRGLDAKTKTTNKVVLARLDALIAEQDARRSSGERCYVVYESRSTRRHSECLSWAEARAHIAWRSLRGARITRVVTRPKKTPRSAA